MKSTIKLFKAVPIQKKGKRESETILKETMKRGFIFTPEVLFNYSDAELQHLIKQVEDEYGITGEKANATFHKSWAKIRDASMLQLVMEQIMHYFTTYGFEALGIYDKDSVYIPNEKLEIPDLDVDGFNFVVIKGLTKDEIKEKLMTFLSSGIALKDTTKKAVVDTCLYLNITTDEIEKIKNKEVRVSLFDFMDKIPSQPLEFLRYCIYKSTNSTLLIKDRETIQKIKSVDNFPILALFYKYKNKYGLERLAEIFYRFKPLFLAFKSETNTQLNSYINKIRKLAIKYHKPMPEDYLNEVTAKIKKGITIDENILKAKLNNVNIFRRIRLAYSLHYRTKDVESILYKIRNGKGFAKEFNFFEKDKAKATLDVVLASIIEEIKKRVKGKKIYIPDYITYTLPATEKQFTGDFPSGTCVKVKEDMIAGVHWTNVDEYRIDLDLSLMSIEGKIGWDRNYRNSDRTTLFSGDITDAPKPKGASELFYLSGTQRETYLMFLNYFNFIESIPVPFKIIVGKKKVTNLSENYMLSLNNVLSVSKSIQDKKERAIGLIVIDEDGCKFYFSETNVGRGITASHGKPHVKHTRQYLVSFTTDMISLNDVLLKAGAIMVDNKDDCDIDLSPDNVDKETFIGLLTK